MRYHHRHSFFPLVIILLTLGLIILMFYAFTLESSPTTSSIQVEETVTIDPEAYRSDLVYIIAQFDDDYSASQDDLSRLLAAEDALSRLLDTQVPSEYKEIHLELAVIFNQLQEGLRKADRSIEEPLNRLDLLTMQYPWLSD